MTCKFCPNDIKGYTKNAKGTKYGKMTCKDKCAPTNAFALKSGDWVALHPFPSDVTVKSIKSKY